MKISTALISLSILTSVVGFQAAAKDVDAKKITCEEFIGLEETVRPRLVLFIEGATKTGHMNGSMVSVDEISKPVAFVEAECHKAPKATVWQKVESYVKKEAKKL